MVDIAKLLMVFAKLFLAVKSHSVSLIIAGGQRYMRCIVTHSCGWLETGRAQAQFPVTYISMFNLSFLT